MNELLKLMNNQPNMDKIYIHLPHMSKNVMLMLNQV